MSTSPRLPSTPRVVLGRPPQVASVARSSSPSPPPTNRDPPIKPEKKRTGFPALPPRDSLSTESDEDDDEELYIRPQLPPPPEMDYATSVQHPPQLVVVNGATRSKTLEAIELIRRKYGLPPLPQMKTPGPDWKCPGCGCWNITFFDTCDSCGLLKPPRPVTRAVEEEGYAEDSDVEDGVMGRGTVTSTRVRFINKDGDMARSQSELAKKLEEESSKKSPLGMTPDDERHSQLQMLVPNGADKSIRVSGWVRIKSRMGYWNRKYLVLFDEIVDSSVMLEQMPNSTSLDDELVVVEGRAEVTSPELRWHSKPMSAANRKKGQAVLVSNIARVKFHGPKGNLINVDLKDGNTVEVMVEGKSDGDHQTSARRWFTAFTDLLGADSVLNLQTAPMQSAHKPSLPGFPDRRVCLVSDCNNLVGEMTKVDIILGNKYHCDVHQHLNVRNVNNPAEVSVIDYKEASGAMTDYLFPHEEHSLMTLFLMGKFTASSAECLAALADCSDNQLCRLMPVIACALAQTPLWAHDQADQVVAIVKKRARESGAVNQMVHTMTTSNLLSEAVAATPYLNSDWLTELQCVSELADALCTLLEHRDATVVGSTFDISKLSEKHIYHPFNAEHRIISLSVEAVLKSAKQPLLLSTCVTRANKEGAQAQRQSDKEVEEELSLSAAALRTELCGAVRAARKLTKATADKKGGMKTSTSSARIKDANSTSAKVAASVQRAQQLRTGESKVFQGGFLLLKKGDDLRQDVACLHMMSFFNGLWMEERLDYPPSSLGSLRVVSLVYGAVAATPDMGMIEFVPNCLPLKKIGEYASRFTQKALHRLITTAAGAYIAAYVLGVRDRHSDNILISVEDGSLFHIDFGHILGDEVNIDTGAYAITPDLKATMGELWTAFIDLACAAFVILRRKYRLVISFCVMLFGSHSPPPHIVQFISDRLRLQMTQDEAVARMRTKLQDAPRRIKTRLKNVVHSIATAIK